MVIRFFSRILVLWLLSNDFKWQQRNIFFNSEPVLASWTHSVHFIKLGLGFILLYSFPLPSPLPYSGKVFGPFCIVTLIMFFHIQTVISEVQNWVVCLKCLFKLKKVLEKLQSFVCTVTYLAGLTIFEAGM